MLYNSMKNVSIIGIIGEHNISDLFYLLHNNNNK